MRKLLGWTVGLVALPVLALRMWVANAVNDKISPKYIQQWAYALGLSDVQE